MFSVSPTHSWFFGVIVATLDWESVGCGFKYRNFCFQKERFSLISCAKWFKAPADNWRMGLLLNRTVLNVLYLASLLKIEKRYHAKVKFGKNGQRTISIGFSFFADRNDKFFLFVFEFFRNTQSWQCWHFCTASNTRKIRNGYKLKKCICKLHLSCYFEIKFTWLIIKFKQYKNVIFANLCRSIIGKLDCFRWQVRSCELP